MSKRESLQQVQDSRRRREPDYVHPELVLPELPPAVAYLWEWYAEELETGTVLTWQEIRAWSEICNNDLTVEEAKTLRRLSIIHHNIITTPLT